MVALLNVESSLPRPMWALARYLRSSRGRGQNLVEARALLSPPRLVSDEGDKEQIFDKAVATSVELGIVERDGEDVRLTKLAQPLAVDDVAGFHDLLRRRVLDRVTPEDLATDPTQTRGKDLLRALCWFLMLDGQTRVTSKTFSGEQQDSQPEELGNPLRNINRWDFFTYWAPALGFAATPLMESGTATALVPDCTEAVQRTVRANWQPGTHLAARDMVDGVLAALPVLPGGRYSRALGQSSASPHQDVGAALAFALLCGHDDEWLIMSAPSDANEAIHLVDPGSAGGIRRVTHIEIGEQP